MSSSKAALSGLRTVKRDWSTSSKTDSDASQKSLDARAQRMRDIQAGLDGREQTDLSFIPPLQSYVNVTTADIASGSKRPLSASPHERTAKKRTLPPSWENDVYTSSSNFTTTTHTSSTTGPAVKTKSTGVSTPTTATPPAQPASVFLSQEQTRILRLVELKDSLFYTGSAGMISNSFIFAHICLQHLLYRYRKVCSFTGNYPHPPENKCKESRRSGNHRLHRCAHMRMLLID